MKEFQNWAIATFNDLVREAFGAQEAWDMFDPRTPEDKPIYDRLTREWEEANRKLVEFVLEYGSDILVQDRSV